MPAVAQALDDAAIRPTDVSAIVCGAGPGSFTSLRIAAGLAKGMSTALDVPLFAVSSLALLVAAAERPAGRYLPLIDALRGEYFAARVQIDHDGRVGSPVVASLLGAADVIPLCEREGLIPIGLDAAGRENPDAAALAHLVGTAATPHKVSVADWEPDYGRLAEAQAKWEREHGMQLSGAMRTG